MVSNDELVEKVQAIADNLTNENKTERHEAFRAFKAFVQTHGTDTWNRLVLAYMKSPANREARGERIER